MTDAAEKALAERARQVARYHRAKAAEWREAIADRPGLTVLRRNINHCADANEMILLADWAAKVFPTYKHLILGLIAKRIQTLRRRAGLLEIDDALPGDERDADDCFQRCKEILT